MLKLIRFLSLCMTRPLVVVSSAKQASSWWLLFFAVQVGWTTTTPAVLAQDKSAEQTKPALREVIAAVPRSWPPQYSVDENGKPIGFAIDVMEEIATRAGVRVKYMVLDTFADVSEVMRKGEADIIPNSGITPDRAAAYLFTEPVETFVVSIFVRRDTTDIQGLEDLMGRRVAVVEHNVGEKLLKPHKDIKSVVHRDAASALFDLLSGREDALVFPEPVMRHLARQAGVEHRIKTVGEPLKELKRAIRVQKSEPELFTALNHATRSFVGSSTYRRIYVKWYGKPMPFWTVLRVTWVMGALLALTLLALIWWRHRSLVRMNKDIMLSEQRYAFAVSGTAEGLWDWSNRAGRQDLYLSPRWKEILGYEDHELENRLETFTGALHPDDHDRVMEAGRAHLKEHVPYDLEYRVRCKDGSFVWVHAKGQAVWDEDGTPLRMAGSISDVTERKQVEETLRHSEERYRRAARLTKMGHWVWDEIEDRCIYCSEELAAIHGVSVEEFIRRDSSLESELEWFHPDDRQHCEFVMREAVRKKTGYEITARIVRDDGEVRYIHEMADAILDADGCLVQTVGVLHDITERKQAEIALAHQAAHDNLTGLLNRYEFERRLARVLEAAYMSQDEHALCYLDLDQFKVVNDTCGHAAGDELLRQLGQLLLASVRKRDTLARLGGDEFAILMEHCTLEQGHRVADNVRNAIAEFRFAWEEQVFRIAVSIGLVPITETSESVDSILSAADSACYAAKDEGRNRVHVYHRDDTELARRKGEMRWVGRINQAFEDDRFQLWSQPIVPVIGGTGEGEHFELLLRFVDEQGETIPPGAFLPAAERYGLSTKLDRWVVDAAFGWLGRNPALLERLHLCCINLSGASLADEEFLTFVDEQLQKSRIPARKICFEVTETAAIANLLRAMTFVEVLQGQGCKFALDDFGSGLSSFAYLKTLPVDYLKIDGAFVKDIADDKVDLALVRSINDVGKVLGKRTIAEFVENEAILEKLREIGVDYAQGYGVGRPAPIEETTSLDAAVI